MNNERREMNIALKRLVTAVILASCIISPVVVCASSPDGKGGPGWFNKVFAANLPAEGGEDKLHQHNSHNPLQHAANAAGISPPRPPMPPGGPFMPPPPPPPPLPSGIGNDQGPLQSQQRQNYPPPPPPETVNKNDGDNKEDKSQSESGGKENSFDNNFGDSEEPSQSWQQGGNWENGNINMPPPPQAYDPWHNQQMMMAQQHHHQQQQPQWVQNDAQTQSIQELQSEIDSLVSHQHELYSQIQNLTSTLIDSDNKADMQVSQIDLLLEQVADAEAYASAESNAALEYKMNCTSLGETIHGLKGSIQDWEKRCSDLTEGRKCDQEEIEKLKEKLKRKERELENMACGVEMARLEKQKEDQAEYERKKSNSQGGFFAWLFGWGSGSSYGDETDEELEKLQEQARSTLLNALQTERNNVDELENALSVSQQNNSAIAEMVASRDSLIDELNDRVAVFEEDKVVLKAALRQLQKEMKEEAPKTKKLVSELKAANSELRKLETSMEALKEEHSKEIKVFNDKLGEKEKLIEETDSKMSMISVYVDQLEERLASFAMARRDITLREEACDSLEETNTAMGAELAKMKEEAENIKNERDEMKNLVDLMVEERTLLQQEKRKLAQDKEKLIFEGKTLQEELDLLNDNFIQLENEAKATNEKLESAELSIVERDEELDKIKASSEESALKFAKQEEMIEKTITLNMSLQKEVQKLKEESDKAVGLVKMLEDRIDEVIAESIAKEAEAESAIEAVKEAEVARMEAEQALAEQVSALEKQKAAEGLFPEITHDATIVEENNDVDTENNANIEWSESKVSMDQEDAVDGETNQIPPPPPPPLEGNSNEVDIDGESEHLSPPDMPVENVTNLKPTPQSLRDASEEIGIDEEFEPSPSLEMLVENRPSVVMTPLSHEDICMVVDEEEDASPLDLSNTDAHDNDVLGQVKDFDKGDSCLSEISHDDSESEIGFDDEENEILTDYSDSGKTGGLVIPNVVEEPPLPERRPPGLPRPNAAFVPKRSVPFRKLRKQVSSMTGIHGFFTPPSRKC